MKTLSVSTYTALRQEVEKTLLLGQQKIEEAKVLTYWKTGQLIDQHLRDHMPEGKERAAYNTRVVEKLTEDLKISDTVLYRCVRFFQQFKKVAARPLSWAHYRALIAVPDEKKRLALADQASKEEWSSRVLEIEIRNLLWGERLAVSDGKAPPLLPVPALGPFFTYKIILPETLHSKSNELLIDLGFSTVLELNRISDHKYKPDAIVTSFKDSKGEYSLRDSRCALSELYTYQAFVERVIDGDTLKVEIDLGFNIRIRQTIRLRAMDCPEMDTPEGVAAKKFVEMRLDGVDYLTIKTVKSDKYDRYLGDVFVPRPPARSQGAQGGDLIYLNNELIGKGHAVRVRG